MIKSGKKGKHMDDTVETDEIACLAGRQGFFIRLRRVKQ
jgi:hypothetical protein